MSVWFHGLNPEQCEAVAHHHGPLLILAGAGSGKTTVLVARAGYLIEQGLATPQEILVLTFTNKAARELVHRVQSKLGAKARGLRAMTFHSFGLWFLRRYHDLLGYPARFGVIDQHDAFGILRELARQVKIDSKSSFDFELVYQLLTEVRSKGRVTSVASEDYLTFVEWVYPRYQQMLKTLAVVDFEDLILRPIDLLRTHPAIREQLNQEIKYWMVDEFQDTNDTQMELLESIFHRVDPNLAVVGDDDQAIYGFRGSEVRHILDFPKRFYPSKIVYLEKNYRSHQKILHLANFVIEKNNERHAKVLRPTRSEQGTVPELFIMDDEFREAQFIANEIHQLLKKGIKPSQIAVLYRANSQSHWVESELRSLGIHYSVTGGISLYDRKEIKDVMSYLRLMLGYHELSFRRVLQAPPRGIGEVTIEKLVNEALVKKCSLKKAMEEAILGDLASSVCEKIKEFLDWYDQLALVLESWEQKRESLNFSRVLMDFLRDVGYVDFLLKLKPESDKKNEEGNDKRLLPLTLFIESCDRFLQKRSAEPTSLRDRLTEFISLYDLRDQWNEEHHEDHVQLMTLHAAKGLEFDYVFLLGVEEDLLPHKILAQDLAEERRLFYVGITRAKTHLILTACRTRQKYGKPRPVALSRFVMGVPDHLLVTHHQGVRPLGEEEIRDQLKAWFALAEQKAKELRLK